MGGAEVLGSAPRTDFHNSCVGVRCEESNRWAHQAHEGHGRRMYSAWLLRFASRVVAAWGPTQMQNTFPQLAWEEEKAVVHYAAVSKGGPATVSTAFCTLSGTPWMEVGTTSILRVVAREGRRRQRRTRRSGEASALRLRSCHGRYVKDDGRWQLGGTRGAGGARRT